MEIFQQEKYDKQEGETASNLKSEKNLNIKSLKILETFPKKIILIKVIDQNFYEGRIRLQNTSDKYVVYKFSIVQHMIYTVSPSVYYIKPFDSITVNVKRFDKVSYEHLKSKEIMDLIAIGSSKEIADINDAKNFIKREDIYSPETQLIKLDIEFDNGNNLINYQNMINERITIAREYNQQLNMNNVDSIEEVNGHIQDLKRQIEDYNTKIQDLMKMLKDISTNNLVEQPKILFDKELFENEIRNKDNRLIPETIPMFLAIFYCCVGLLLGKLLHKLI